MIGSIGFVRIRPSPLGTDSTRIVGGIEENREVPLFLPTPYSPRWARLKCDVTIFDFDDRSKKAFIHYSNVSIMACLFGQFPLSLQICNFSVKPNSKKRWSVDGLIWLLWRPKGVNDRLAPCYIIDCLLSSCISYTSII